MPSSPVAVTVVGGYLGAGKTTLVNHLLAVADERVAVFVNDFGELDIDARLIAGASGTTITLPNGCICCSLVDGLAAALDDLSLVEPLPERLVIEASGVADPAGITAFCHRRPYHLDLVVVLADADRIGRQVDDEYVGETVRRQLAAADLVVLNKADLGDVHAARGVVAEQAPRVPIAVATNSAIDPRVLLDLESPDGEPVPQPFHDHGVPFETWSWCGGQIADTRLRAMATALPAGVVRAKGLVATEAGPVVFQQVGDRWTIEPTDQAVTESRVVAIGVPGALGPGWLPGRLDG